MKILAWTTLVLMGLSALLEPFVFGKSRGTYGATTWIGAIASLALYVPLCGRVLGWW